jgi:hypothetical protein
LAKGGKPIELVFIFDRNHPIQNKQELISKILGLVCRIENFPTGQISKNLFNDIPEISFLYINQDLSGDHRWMLFHSGGDQMMSISRLVEIIREKECKAKGYRKCDTYWLLVVVDFINPAMDQEIQIEGVELKSDIFENIILYKTGFEDIIEFKK